MHQPEWWAIHYRTILGDLTKRVRQYLDEDLPKGVLVAFLDGVEQELKEVKH